MSAAVPGGTRAARAEAWLEEMIFGHRVPILVLFALGSLVLGAIALHGLRIDTSFNKTLPVRHEYMRTYLDPRVAEFRGANRVLVALMARNGDMFTPEFFAAMRKATDEVTVMDGIDRARVQSIFTPNVRYLEVVEDGIEAGNVIPADFTPTPQNMARVRDNIRKAGIVGRLVANDFSGALVSAIVLDQDAQGHPVDPIQVAHRLEHQVRQALQTQGHSATGIDVRIIGFAQVMGDIADGASAVVMFAVITLVLTLLAVWLYCQSWRIALVPVACSVIAVVWQLGALVLMRYGIDPIGLLVPFLIFAIGVSHGVQKISAVGDLRVRRARQHPRRPQHLPPAAGAGHRGIAGGPGGLRHHPHDPGAGHPRDGSDGLHRRGGGDPDRPGAAAGAGQLCAL